MIPTHFSASRLSSNDGYTWTLPSRLGAMLREAEDKFGQRDMSWTILGVEFGPNTPQLWYPGNCKYIVIQLASNALADTILACYQLAHECVHLLSPDGAAGTTVIEEGLATVFAEDYVCREFNISSPTNLPSYRNAAAIVRKLLAVCPNSIRKLRSIEPAFKRMSDSTFNQAALNITNDMTDQLISKFSRE